MFWRTLALFLLLLETKGWNLMFVGWTKGDWELELKTLWLGISIGGLYLPAIFLFSSVFVDVLWEASSAVGMLAVETFLFIIFCCVSAAMATAGSLALFWLVNCDSDSKNFTNIWEKDSLLSPCWCIMLYCCGFHDNRLPSNPFLLGFNFSSSSLVKPMTETISFMTSLCLFVGEEKYPINKFFTKSLSTMVLLLLCIWFMLFWSCSIKVCFSLAIWLTLSKSSCFISNCSLSLEAISMLH